MIRSERLGSHPAWRGVVGWGSLGYCDGMRHSSVHGILLPTLGAVFGYLVVPLTGGADVEAFRGGGEKIYACEDKCEKSPGVSCATEAPCTHQFGFTCHEVVPFTSDICVNGVVFEWCQNSTVGSSDSDVDPTHCSETREDNNCNPIHLAECQFPIEECGTRTKCTGINER